MLKLSSFIIEVALSRTCFIVDRAGATVLGSGALRFAVRLGYLSVVRYLFSKSRGIEDAIPVANYIRAAQSALTEAARRGHVDVTRFLLENGADVEMRAGKMSEKIHFTVEELAEKGGHAQAAMLIREWKQRGEGG